MTDLQTALNWAVAGSEIWVAEGIYTPTNEFSPGDPRSATFQLKNGVALYGGFDPTVGDVGWADRDWVNNVTILSGDIGAAGDPRRQQLPRLLPSAGVGPGRHCCPGRLYGRRRQREG